MHGLDETSFYPSLTLNLINIAAHSTPTLWTKSPMTWIIAARTLMFFVGFFAFTTDSDSSPLSTLTTNGSVSWSSWLRPRCESSWPPPPCECPCPLSCECPWWGKDLPQTLACKTKNILEKRGEKNKSVCFSMITSSVGITYTILNTTPQEATMIISVGFTSKFWLMQRSTAI